ncbi:MAG TPA: hypothetical protein VGQ42_16230 [Candidatus Dormibacteraeota bacterium]|jgi:hypothetical protein|nr:hypothetical protein [Candidatus Dormibacteraeota bacterium]
MAEPQSKGPERGEPFITRRSLLWFSAVATAAFVAYSELYDASSKGAGRMGMVAAGAFGVAAVLGIIAWVGGIRLAGRSGSLLWLVVVAMTPVVGSLCYALWGPPVVAAPPGAPGGGR